MTRVENAAPASNAPDPLSTLRREIFGFFIAPSIRLFWQLVLRKLSLIPAARIESFVDNAFALQLGLLRLDLAAGFGQTGQKRLRIREIKMTGRRFALVLAATLFATPI